MRNIFLIGFLTMALLLVSCAQEDLPPEPRAPGDVSSDAFVGGAYHEGLEELDFAEPTSFSFDPDRIIFTHADDRIPVRLAVEGEQYVYKRGYFTQDGSDDWDSFIFDGDIVRSSNWIKGTAELEGHFDYLDLEPGKYYAVAYACTKVAGSWDCHDNNDPDTEGDWMIQEIIVTKDQCRSDSECYEGQICEDGYCIELPSEPDLPGATSADELKCYETVEEDDELVLGGNRFAYKSSDRPTDISPKVKIKNLENGESYDRSISERAVFKLKNKGQTYVFSSFTNYNVDDYIIKLVTPCDKGTTCSELIEEDDNFVLDGTNFEYKGADKMDDTNPKVRFENEETEETLELTPEVVVYFDLKYEGKTYIFKSVSDYSRKDWDMQLIYPCTLAVEPAKCTTDLADYPCYFDDDGRFDGFLVVGEEAESTDNFAATDIAANMGLMVIDATKLDSEIANVEAQNLISVGNPCVNQVTAELLGNSADCIEGFNPGQGKFILKKHSNGNRALIVAGYSGADTRLMGKILAYRPEILSGTHATCSGTTYSDAVCTTSSSGGSSGGGGYSSFAHIRPSLGDDNAPVIITWFGDYQCPFTKRFFDETLNEIIEEYIDEDEVRLVFRDFPLPHHEEANGAAVAAKCAWAEEDLYWAMADKLFENQAILDEEEFPEWAEEIGIDDDDFIECFEESYSYYSNEIENDFRFGTSLGVLGTPTFFVNGIRVSGAQPMSVFREQIENQLLSAREVDEGSLNLGETKEYYVGGYDWPFELTLAEMDDGAEGIYAVFTLNGESTPRLREGDSHEFSFALGAKVEIKDFLYQDYGGGIKGTDYDFLLPFQIGEYAEEVEEAEEVEVEEPAEEVEEEVVEEIESDSDRDRDGIVDKEDNCPFQPNADQANNDEDLLGDVCDVDDDNDGIYDCGADLECGNEDDDSCPFDPDTTSICI